MNEITCHTYKETAENINKFFNKGYRITRNDTWTVHMENGRGEHLMINKDY